MKRLILSVIFLILFALPIYSQNIKVYGIASKGGKVIRTSTQVQNTVMETYPSCTITVYQTGTLTLASIFSNETGTIKSNPFTANLDASWSFYVASGRYDIKFSGTGILTPFTVSDVFVNAASGGGGGTVTSVFGRTGDVVYQIGDVPFTGLNFSGSNFNSITTRSASDLNAGTLPDATFPATLPTVSGVNLTNLNATNITSGTLNDARLSTNVPLKNTTNTFTQNNIFSSSVGVNTSTPRRRLDVLDGSNAQIRLSAVDNSVYTDLFVDSGGSLNILPTGNVAFNSVGKQVNPLNNFDQNLGQINKKWLSLHAAELFVETLVAQNTIATIGGRIIVAPSNVLIADLAPSTTTIQVKYNNLASGDRIYMEGNSSVEFMAVTSGASVISGGFSYSVTRNLDGTGANQWFAGDALVDTGVAGNGFIDLYSTRGVKASTQLGPTIVGNVRNSSTFNDWSENWAIGNLNGIYGYGSDTYGAAFGKYAAGVPHITVDSTLGFRIYHGLSTIRAAWGTSGDLIIGTEASGQSNLFVTNAGRLSVRNNTTERIRLDTDGSGFVANNLISWDAAGNLTVAGNALIGGVNIGNGKMFVGTGTFNNTNTGFYVDSTGQFSLKDKLSWDGTTLSIIGNGAFSGDLTGTNMLLTGKLALSGINSAITIGTTPPTSSSSGTGIFIDRTGLYGLSSGVNQIKIDAIDGSILGGAGFVKLDATGLTIVADTTLKTNASINFREISGNEVVGILRASYASNVSVLNLNSQSPTGVTNGKNLLNVGNINNAVYGSTHATFPNKRYVAIGSTNGVLISSFGVAAELGESFTASTVLEINSTTGAVLFPRMSSTERNALTPTNGMVIYNLTTDKLQVYAAGSWTDLH